MTLWEIHIVYRILSQKEKEIIANLKLNSFEYVDEMSFGFASDSPGYNNKL